MRSLDASSFPAQPLGRRARRKQGLLLMPEFPIDSFWSYRYVLRLTGRQAAYPPLGLLTFAGYLDPAEWDLELLDLGVTTCTEQELRGRMAAADVMFLSAMSIQKRALVDVLRVSEGLATPMVLG